MAVTELIKLYAPKSDNPLVSESYTITETNVTHNTSTGDSEIVTTIFDKQIVSENGVSDWITKPYVAPEFNGTSSSAKVNFTTGALTNNTVEFWVYLKAIGKQQYFFTSGNGGFSVGVNSSNQVMIVRSLVQIDKTFTAQTLQAKTWYHIAITKNGNNFTLFLNGAKTDSVYTSSNEYTIKEYIQLGGENTSYYLDGYLEGFRLFEGIKYTIPFPCPMSWRDYIEYDRVNLQDSFKTYPELVKVVHSKIGTKVKNDCGSGYCVNDWAGLGWNTASIDDWLWIGDIPLYFSNEGMNLPYDFPVYMGKGCPFTIDFWAKAETDSGSGSWPIAFDLFSNLTAGRGYYMHVIPYTKVPYARGGAATSSSAYTENGFTTHAYTNDWNHYAFIKKEDGTCVIFVNGVQSSRTCTGNNYTWPQGLEIGGIGKVSGASAFCGRIAHFRMCYGERWSKNFAVPYSSDYYRNTVEKTHYDATNNLDRTVFFLGGSLKDSSSTGASISSNGVVLQDLSHASVNNKIFDKALYFNGADDTYISVKLSEVVAENKNFTLDWWECRQNNGTIACLNTSTSSAYSNLLISHQGGKLYGSYADSGWDRFNGVQAFDDSVRNTWTHYALVKNGTQYTVYKNGSQYWTAAQASSLTFSNSSKNSFTLLIGKHADSSGPNNFKGYINALRFSNFARWTSNFTPPSSKSDYNMTEDKSVFKTGQILDINYSGHATRITLPKGKYRLQAWGASGGGGYVGTIRPGGSGGYSEGVLNLKEAAAINMWAGGIGEDSSSKNTQATGTVYSGGYNNGGSAKVVSYSGTTTIPSGGGGMTDIVINSDTTHVGGIVVAGGGSGATNFNEGYAGGGLTGDGYSDAYKGKQTAGGTGSNKIVGASANPSSTNYKYAGSGAGGGWYGGGSTSNYSDSDSSLPKQNGGGSGFVFTAETASSVPSDHVLTSDYYLTEATTIAGNVEHPGVNGQPATSHFGAGYIRITVLAGATDIRYKDDDGWKPVSKILVKESTNGVEGWKELEFDNANAAKQILMPYVNKISKSNTFYSWSRYNLGDPHTKLLINGSGATVKDISNYDQALSVNNVELNTDIKKFNNASLAFKYGRLNSWIEFNASNVFDWNSDWTIDWWEYIPSIVNATCIYNQTTNAANSDRGILIGYQSSSNNEYFYCTSTTSSWDICNSVNMGAITVNQWVHRAVVRSGNNYYTFRDGTLISSSTSTKTILAGANIGAIGRYANGTSYFKGLIDDFRISDEARWTANFSVPTSSPTGKTYEGIITANDKAAYPSKGIGSGGYYYVRW